MRSGIDVQGSIMSLVLQDVEAEVREDLSLQVLGARVYRSEKADGVRRFHPSV